MGRSFSPPTAGRRGGKRPAYRSPMAQRSSSKFTSPLVGFALTGEANGRILRTTDGADSWTQVAISRAPLSDITFVTPTTAYAVGASGTLLHSIDAGSTWTALPLALPSGTPTPTLARISCGDPMHCVIVALPTSSETANALVVTSDGGMTGSLVTPSQQDLLGVAFTASSTVVAVGESGVTRAVGRRRSDISHADLEQPQPRRVWEDKAWPVTARRLRAVADGTDRGNH